MITPEQLKAMRENYEKNYDQIILEQNITRVLNKIEKNTENNCFELYVVKSYDLEKNDNSIHFGESDYEKVKKELKNRGWTIVDPIDGYFIVTA